VIAPKADTPLMSPEQAAKVLERVIYEQVASCIDFELLQTTEHELCFALFDVGVDTDDVQALAAQLIDVALDQLKRDARRTIDVRSSPFPDCDLCEEEARVHHARSGPPR
jgi:hypothetical protein